LARVYGERKRNFVGQHFWASGDQGIHQEAGDRRCSPRSTQHVALRPPSGGPNHRGRVSAPNGRFERPNS
jgi:hypothetical protein